MKVFIIRNLENPTSVEYSNACANSCEEHGVKYEFYEGSWGRSLTELKSLMDIDYPIFTDPFSYEGKFANNMYNQYMYLHMAVELKEPIAILEHDIIVKHNFTDLQIEHSDNSIYYLACCVDDKNHYNYPHGSETSFTKVKYYDGNRAKILTPEFSRQFLEFKSKYPDNYSWVQFYKTINQYLVDPIPTVCELGKRVSTITGMSTSPVNEFLPKSFFDNLQNKDLKDYYINSIKECYRNPINYATYMELSSK